MPERIQLSRRKGYRKPPDAVVVARPSKWGNPWSVLNHSAKWWVTGPYDLLFPPFPTQPAATAKVVELFCIYASKAAPAVGRITAPWTLDDLTEELGGRDLACWCSLDQPCHADVLLELANP